MRKLSEIKETYFRELPRKDAPHKSDDIQQIEEFAKKEKKAEIIKAWTKIKDHPTAEDMSSPVGSAFCEEDLESEMGAAFEAIGEKGIIYCSFEHSFWIRHKGLLIRVL